MLYSEQHGMHKQYSSYQLKKMFDLKSSPENMFNESYQWLSSLYV